MDGAPSPLPELRPASAANVSIARPAQVPHAAGLVEESALSAPEGGMHTSTAADSKADHRASQPQAPVSSRSVVPTQPSALIASDDVVGVDLRGMPPSAVGDVAPPMSSSATALEPLSSPASVASLAAVTSTGKVETAADLAERLAVMLRQEENVRSHRIASMPDMQDARGHRALRLPDEQGEGGALSQLDQGLRQLDQGLRQILRSAESSPLNAIVGGVEELSKKTVQEARARANEFYESAAGPEYWSPRPPSAPALAHDAEAWLGGLLEVSGRSASAEESIMDDIHLDTLPPAGIPDKRAPMVEASDIRPAVLAAGIRDEPDSAGRSAQTTSDAGVG